MTKWTKIIANNSFNTSENQQKIKNAINRRGINNLMTHGYNSGVNFHIVEDNGETEIIFGDRGIKYDDKLAELLSEELGMKVIQSPKKDSWSTIFKVVKANWKDETYVSSESARFVYNIILDFASVEQALNFRETFRGKSYYHYRPKDYPYNYDYKIVSDNADQIELTDYEIEDMKKGKNFWKKLPLDTTHFEFHIAVEVQYKNNVDNNGLEQQIKQEIKQELEQKHNAKVEVQFITPKMKEFKDNTSLSTDLENRKDTLFEGLSTSELKHYDFIIVGRTQEEVDKLNERYIQIMNKHFTSRWLTLHKTKEDIKKSDYDNRKGDMAYLKTKSDTLDSGIYCFTTRARNYFQSWEYNNGKEMLLPVFLDAKASQLGGKVVVAKKINKWKIK